MPFSLMMTSLDWATMAEELPVFFSHHLPSPHSILLPLSFHYSSTLLIHFTVLYPWHLIPQSCPHIYTYTIQSSSLILVAHPNHLNIKQNTIWNFTKTQVQSSVLETEVTAVIPSGLRRTNLLEIIYVKVPIEKKLIITLYLPHYFY